MEEEIKKTNEEKGKEKKPSTNNSGDGIQPETKTKIELANEAAERIENANKKTEELANRLEATKTEEILGGKSEAGTQKPKKTDDEKWAEKAKERYEGTGLDPTPDDKPTEYI